ncbi:uncharacterized protein si:ch211-57n23.1 [Gadus macrocephalus]|uniref:uncharacterized protein si:ch211-57n23.1 n=1 Tax=Gadus macrocephalus TaxID=80720 RepID=UPI0028CB5C0E|nr:uncharacterized protein si:ch211-57n23.1 [Gadus macrocephalus]
MVEGEVRWTWLGVSCCLLLCAVSPAGGESAAGEPPDLFWDWELGSGGGRPLPQEEFLHIFSAADSPFVTETLNRPANCSQRFRLPSATAVCWGEAAGPEELARSRQLVLQNQAALEAVATSCGTEVEEGVSTVTYAQRVRGDLRGVVVDHQSMGVTMDTMQQVLTSLQEKRREGTEQKVYLSMREHLASAGDSIHGREQIAENLEHQLSHLETSLLNMQHRLNKILMQ